MKQEEAINATMQQTAKAQQSFIKEVTIMIKQKTVVNSPKGEANKEVPPQ